ncbi:GAF domain-containing protein [Chitinimonas naiadis]
MTPAEYLSRAGLQTQLTAEAVQAHLAAYAELAETTRVPAQLDSLYRYKVPELGENGACSLPDQLMAEPYDLAVTLGGETADASFRLAVLKRLVDQIVSESGCGWLGVYQAREVSDGRALVKLAYAGKPSRAEFPLTAEFAEYSNNSAVGLSGQGRIIDNVDSYVAEGGAYYTCDAEVQSEACLPLFAEDGELLGIIDAEDERRDFFRGEVLARLLALCLLAPNWLPE